MAASIAQIKAAYGWGMTYTLETKISPPLKTSPSVCVSKWVKTKEGGTL